MDLKLTNEQKILLYLLSNAVSNTSDALEISQSDFEEVDWKKVFKESKQNAVSLITFEHLLEKKSKIPEKVYESWKHFAMRVFSMNFIVANAQNELVKILEDDNIPYVILKGLASAFYYSKPEMRSLGDVDFLVSEKDKEKVSSLLISAGYKKSKNKNEVHEVFYKDGAVLEMHFEIAGVPYGDKANKIHSQLSKVLEERVRLNVFGNEFYAPKAEHHALIILLHMQHHMLGEGFGLRHLLDWAFLIKKTSEEGFWQERTLPFFKEIGVYNYAKVLTKICSNYFMVELPKFAESANDKICLELLIDIIESGNFGCKDKSRVYSGALISDRGRNGTNNNMLGQALKRVHRNTIAKKWVRKFIIIYPFAYAFTALKYLFILAFNKNDKYDNVISKSKKRKQIYKKLKIFETEKGE